MKHSFNGFLLLSVALTFLLSCGGAGENKLGEYDWLEGTWNGYNEDFELYGKAIIEPSRYKCVMWDKTESPANINKVEWMPIDIASREVEAFYDSYITLDDHSIVIVNEEDKTIGIVSGDDCFVYLKKDEKSTPKKKNSHDRIITKSSNKLWNHAFDYGKCAVFSTGYRQLDTPVYIALFPFVYSEDGLEGKMYEIRVRDQSLWFLNAGDYEVHGNYVRFFNIRCKDEHNNDRFYQISEADGKLTLEGRVIGQPKDKITMKLSSDERVIRVAEEILQQPRFNEHGPF